MLKKILQHNISQKFFGLLITSAPYSIDTFLISLESEETKTLWIFLLFLAASIEWAIRGFPPIENKFLFFKPFDPPLAKIKA